MFLRHCSALRHSHVFINDQQLTDFQLPTMWPYQICQPFLRVQNRRRSSRSRCRHRSCRCSHRRRS